MLEGTVRCRVAGIDHRLQRGQGMIIPPPAPRTRCGTTIREARGRSESSGQRLTQSAYSGRLSSMPTQRGRSYDSFPAVSLFVGYRGCQEIIGFVPRRLGEDKAHAATKSGSTSS